MNDSNLLTAEEIAAKYRCAPRTVRDKKAKHPNFPKPVRGRVLLWYADEVERFFRLNRAA